MKKILFVFAIFCISSAYSLQTPSNTPKILELLQKELVDIIENHPENLPPFRCSVKNVFALSSFSYMPGIEEALQKSLLFNTEKGKAYKLKKLLSFAKKQHFDLQILSKKDFQKTFHSGIINVLQRGGNLKGLIKLAKKENIPFSFTPKELIDPLQKGIIAYIGKEKVSDLEELFKFSKAYNVPLSSKLLENAFREGLLSYFRRDHHSLDVSDTHLFYYSYDAFVQHIIDIAHSYKIKLSIKKFPHLQETFQEGFEKLIGDEEYDGKDINFFLQFAESQGIILNTFSNPQIKEAFEKKVKEVDEDFLYDIEELTETSIYQKLKNALSDGDCFFFQDLIQRAKENKLFINFSKIPNIQNLLEKAVIESIQSKENPTVFLEFAKIHGISLNLTDKIQKYILKEIATYEKEDVENFLQTAQKYGFSLQLKNISGLSQAFQEALIYGAYCNNIGIINDTISWAQNYKIQLSIQETYREALRRSISLGGIEKIADLITFISEESSINMDLAAVPQIQEAFEKGLKNLSKDPISFEYLKQLAIDNGISLGASD